MSKHSRKHSRQRGDDRGNNFDMNQIGNLFNNINPNQLAGLLNNTDMNQLSSMLQGFMNNSQGGDNIAGSSTAPVSMDRRIELLNAIKPLVDAEKSRLIDSILQVYTITRIMKR